MAKIAKLSMLKTAKLLQEQGYQVQTTDAAIAQLAKEGYDPVYGARPLRRLIQSTIENPIALLLIGKTFVPGDTIVIDYDTNKNTFTFTKGAGAVPSQDEQPVNNSTEGQGEEKDTLSLHNQEAASSQSENSTDQLSAAEPQTSQGVGMVLPQQDESKVDSTAMGQAVEAATDQVPTPPQPAYPSFDPNFDPTTLAGAHEEEQQQPASYQNGSTNGNGTSNGTYNTSSANGLSQTSGSSTN